MTTTVHLLGPQGLRQCVGFSEVAALLESGVTFWVDTDESGEAVSQFLTQVLKLHPLAAEDILLDRPSPKVEDYGEYLYVVAQGVADAHEGMDELVPLELDLVVTARWVLTHHAPGFAPSREVQEELTRNPRLLERGPAFVAHAVLDHLVDSYLPVMDVLDGEIDTIETAVLEHPGHAVIERLFRLKRVLQHLRRMSVHQREVLQRLSRGEFEQIPEKALPFYRDAYDHFVRVVDLSEGYREMLSGALDVYLSVVSNRMNEVMKALTLMATVMMPLTFIAGVYGMNFEHMPELKWPFGYAFAWLVMLSVAVGMLVWFRRKKWM